MIEQQYENRNMIEKIYITKISIEKKQYKKGKKKNYNKQTEQFSNKFTDRKKTSIK